MTDFYEIDFCDVETKKSGDAIAIRYRIAGLTFIHVVDAGYTSTAPRLIELIRTYYDNPQRIDHLVVTHGDFDHAGGVPAIIDEFEIGAIWMLRPWMYAHLLVNQFRRVTSVQSLSDRLRQTYPYL